MTRPAPSFMVDKILTRDIRLGQQIVITHQSSDWLTTNGYPTR